VLASADVVGRRAVPVSVQRPGDAVDVLRRRGAGVRGVDGARARDEPQVAGRHVDERVGGGLEVADRFVRRGPAERVRVRVPDEVVDRQEVRVRSIAS
jgi:hypothetical protein